VVSVVTTASLTDPELCVLLNQDEEVGYGFDEPDELTHAHAVTIHVRRAKSTPPGRLLGDQRVADLAAHPDPLSLSP
jgi:hypothetical protein